MSSVALPLPRAAWHLAVPYALTIFLSAFLLFQVQPMIGRMILPWFGGSAAVWTTCMLFFQMLLLAGYAYSHLMPRLLTPRAHALVHVALLAASLLCLPLAPVESLRPTGDENPTLRILLLLGATLGLPYFTLSTTGPLVQAWFARERTDAVPYRLFALSNLGSLLALLAYPLVIEPALPTQSQSWLWSGLYLLFTLCCGGLCWRGARMTSVMPGASGANPAQPAPSLLLSLTWIALAACPSVLLLADTGFLSENVAPIPLLWVLPLALYLLSFIFCFERQGWYRRRLFLPLFVVGLGLLAWLPTLGMNALPVLWSVAIHLGALFVVCMVCHGELSRLRPPAHQLTAFYLMLAVGGAVGGLFVGLVAPYCLQNDDEYSIALMLSAVVVAWVLFARGETTPLPRWRLVPVVLAIAVLGWIRVGEHLDAARDARLLVRDFYGAQGVFDVDTGLDAHRTLMHGQIIHGKQFTDPSRRRWPTAYYGQTSGVGLAVQALRAQSPLSIGVVGLGAGTLAAYGQAGDQLRFYEIDPLVAELARSQFSFLADSAAASTIVLGDARLSLERDAAARFDLLAVDAFSGDSVPVHLLTREAFAIYLRHLKPQGVLAVHVTNRFLELVPVVRAAAEREGATARLVESDSDGALQLYHARWVLISRDARVFARVPLAGVARDIPATPPLRPWTDDYSSVFAVLK